MKMGINNQNVNLYTVCDTILLVLTLYTHSPQFDALTIAPQ